MGVAAMLREALVFPLRRMGLVLILITGVIRGTIERLGEETEGIQAMDIVYLAFYLGTWVILEVRSAGVTLMGGNHLFASPGGPWGKALIAFLLSAALIDLIFNTLLATTLPPEIMIAIMLSSASVLTCVPAALYGGAAIAATIGENHLRGVAPRRVWRVIRNQPTLCLLYLVPSVASSFLLERDFRALSLTQCLFSVMIAHYLLAVCGRLIGRMAIGYRAALPAPL